MTPALIRRTRIRPVPLVNLPEWNARIGMEPRRNALAYRHERGRG